MEIRKYTLKMQTEKKLRFAFLSDMHDCDNFVLIDALEKISLDAVLVGGDFVHSTEKYKRGIEFLWLCAEKYPTFCSIGNHERKTDTDVAFLVSQSGAVLLDDRAQTFCGVHIGGLSSGYAFMEKQGHFEKTPAPNLEWLNKFSRLRGAKILLCHHPEYYPRYIKDKNIDLTLSGHAHGGQWRFFGRGVFAPGQGLFPKYTSGIYDGKFIVSRGLGNQTPYPRINNKEEIIVIDIVPKEKIDIL